MRYIADFHLHSSFSRATSSKITLESMNHWAKVKGINILSVLILPTLFGIKL